MKKTLLLTAALTLVAGPAFASGYRIPEQSINAVALSNAYVANANSADASYYNPANMSWLPDKWQSELNLSYINLPSVEYTASNPAASATNSGSRTEDFLVPTLYLVSPEYNNFRFGFSVTHPYGLSKRWDNAYPKATAEEFTLKVFEFNPTVSYKISDKLSVAAGARMLYSDGKVKSNGSGIGVPAIRDLSGDSTDFGYNLAISYLPCQNVSLAATYRSKVNLNLEGDALINSVAYGAEVMVPAPALLTLAAAYTRNKTTFEFTYDKTYWSAYDKLDFNYSTRPPGLLGTLFDDPKPKNWGNTDAFRFGITHQCTKELTAMVGFAIDKNPIPDNTLGFELPDSDAKLYSIGARYKYNENLTLGAAYLYDDKESRTVANASPYPSGTFTDSAAHLVTLGAQYTF